LGLLTVKANFGPSFNCLTLSRNCGREVEAEIADAGITLLRPTRKGEPPRPGERFFKPLRQIIESVNDTLKGQLDLDRHGGRTITGVCARIAQRLLALTAAIWHNDQLGLTRRSLIAYDQGPGAMQRCPARLVCRACLINRPAYLFGACRTWRISAALAILA
jgi:hypothetical protein